MVGVKTKPLGTITKYYPFIDDETRDVIDSVMDEAENYRDFAVRLVEKVVSEELTPSLVYLAAEHAGGIHVHDAMEKLSEKYEALDIIRPRILWSQYDSGRIRNITPILDAIDKVLTEHTDDWLAVEMLGFKARIALESVQTQDQFPDISEKAEKLLKSRNEFRCFSPFIYWVRSSAVYEEQFPGGFEEALKFANMAFRIASEFNDDLHQATALIMMASVYKNFDATKAIEHVDKAIGIFEKLDARVRIGAAHNDLGLISVILGEVDQAIECFSHSIEIGESEGSIFGVVSFNLARVYVSTGRGKEALETMEKSFDSMKEYALAHFLMAEALILLDRTNEAAEYLDSGLELAIKSDHTRNTVWYYSTRGMLEKANGDIKAAVRSYRRALSISDELPEIIPKLQVLIRLIEAEMIAFFTTNAHQHIESAQLLLSRLEQLANEQNLYGVSVTVAILKADIDKAEGRKDTARERLTSALELCQSSAMKSLRSQVEESLELLDVDESTSEIAERFSSRITSMTVPAIQTREVPFTVLGCIMMLREVGIEVYSKYVDKRLAADPSLVAGLLSAMSTFVQELREGARGELQSIVHQDIAVLLEHGKHVTCALLTDKDTFNARSLQVRFLEQFEEDFSNVLVGFDGRVSDFRAAEEIFELVFKEKLV